MFLGSAGLYALSRWLVRPLLADTPNFFESYFNDLLCIPFLLPSTLLLCRWLRVRRHDAMPTMAETASVLVIWSFCFEWVAPRMTIFPKTVGDPFDVLWYAFGAIGASIIWSCKTRTGENENGIGSRMVVRVLK